MRKFKKLTMTLVALFAMTAGAWAETETISTASDLWQGAKTFTGTNVTVSVENGGNENGSYVSSIYTMNISVTGDNIITGLVLTIGYNATKAGYMLALPGNCTASGSGSHSTFVTVTDIDASSVTMKMDEYAVYVEKVEVTYANPDAPMPVAGQTNQWQFTMPAADVELQVEYYPGMLTFAPNATEGGTVEVVGLTDDALPAGFEKDEEGNIYVAKGTTFTVKATPEEGYHLVSLSDGTNTYQVDNNGMATIIMPDDESDLTLTASFAEDTYSVSFAEGVNPEPPTEPEWTASPATDVTKGETVTVTYSGSKKVIGVKAEKKAAAGVALKITSPSVGQVIGSDGKNYDYASLPSGVTVVALICYVNGSNGLALAIEDEGQMNWSTAITTAAAHTPAFTGGTWKLPDNTEWNNMCSGAGGFATLRNSFSGIGGTNLKQDQGYWSLTDENSSDAYEKWFEDGGFYTATKSYPGDYVRACLAF